MPVLGDKKHPLYLIPISQLGEVIYKSVTIKDCLEKLEIPATSYSYELLNKIVKDAKINIEHFTETRLNHLKQLSKIHIPLEQIIIEHSTYPRHSLKRRLLKLGLLKNECYECGLGPSWREKTLSLQLDHENGISDDNRLENLRMLCPNCHSQTETFAGKSSRFTIRK